MSDHRYIGFKSSLEDDDYGIIISSDGKLKGVWIPKSQEDETIPQSIVQICIDNFGIDPNSDQEVSQTVH